MFLRHVENIVKHSCHMIRPIRSHLCSRMAGPTYQFSMAAWIGILCCLSTLHTNPATDAQGCLPSQLQTVDLSYTFNENLVYWLEDEQFILNVTYFNDTEEFWYHIYAETCSLRLGCLACFFYPYLSVPSLKFRSVSAAQY